MRVAFRYSWEVTFEDLLIETLHVISSEGRFQSNDFVQDTTEGPYVTFNVIRLIPPNFRTRIIRSAGLRVVKTPLIGYFRHIHVSKFGSEIFIEENIRTLQVSVHYVEVVHRLETPHHLDKDAPDILLRECRLVFLML